MKHVKIKKCIEKMAVAGLGIGIGFVLEKKRAKRSNVDYKMYADKHLAILELFDQWMMKKQEGKTVSDYLRENGFRTIAIYGMGYLGKRLYDELKDSEIEVRYAIDKNADNLYLELDVISPDENMPEVDLIIVTAVYFFDEIEGMLTNLTECPVVSFEDILYEM